MPLQTLSKREDYAHEEAAQAHPGRTYYYRRDADVSQAIAQADARIGAAPADAAARATRGTLYMKVRAVAPRPRRRASPRAPTSLTHRRPSHRPTRNKTGPPPSKT